LVVLIAIIAILAAILFPVFPNACKLPIKQAARRTLDKSAVPLRCTLMAPRHNQGANLCFVDGRVKWLKDSAIISGFRDGDLQPK